MVAIGAMIEQKTADMAAEMKAVEAERAQVVQRLEQEQGARSQAEAGQGRRPRGPRSWAWPGRRRSQARRRGPGARRRTPGGPGGTDSGA